MRKLFVIISLLVVFTVSYTLGQESNPTKDIDTYTKLELGYLFGGQIYNDNFSYNPGIQAQGSFGFSLNNRVNLGIGMGYYQLTHERFIPIFAEVIGYTHGSNKYSHLISMQLGYSPAWYSEQVGYSGYAYKGGIYFDTGIGMQRIINNSSAIYFRLSYRHQFAKISYELFQGTRYSETLNYDLLNIAIGIKFNN